MTENITRKTWRMAIKMVICVKQNWFVHQKDMEKCCDLRLTFQIHKKHFKCCHYGWLRGTVVERRSVTSKLSLSYARPAAHG